MKKFLATLAIGAAIAAAPASVQAQGPVVTGGLVNVTVTDIANNSLNNLLSKNNVAVGVAAQIAAQLCGISVGPVAVLAAQAVRTGEKQTVCTTTGTQPQRVEIVPAAR